MHILRKILGFILIISGLSPYLIYIISTYLISDTCFDSMICAPTQPTILFYLLGLIMVFAGVLLLGKNFQKLKKVLGG